jgi:CheY-like chemotaxis protein
MPKTLLLADDSVTIQKVVGITFANEDVELVTAPNGDDALRRARDLKPDLVMADVRRATRCRGGCERLHREALRGSGADRSRLRLARCPGADPCALTQPREQSC